jgi:hypothetical protein
MRLAISSAAGPMSLHTDTSHPRDLLRDPLTVQPAPIDRVDAHIAKLRLVTNIDHDHTILRASPQGRRWASQTPVMRTAAPNRTLPPNRSPRTTAPEISPTTGTRYVTRDAFVAPTRSMSVK